MSRCWIVKSLILGVSAQERGLTGMAAKTGNFLLFCDAFFMRCVMVIKIDFFIFSI